jgi:hypothetical protein
VFRLRQYARFQRHIPRIRAPISTAAGAPLTGPLLPRFAQEHLNIGSKYFSVVDRGTHRLDDRIMPDWPDLKTTTPKALAEQ